MPPDRPVQELLRQMLTAVPVPVGMCSRCREPLSEVYLTRDELHLHYTISWDCMHYCTVCQSWRCGYGP